MKLKLLWPTVRSAEISQEFGANRRYYEPHGFPGHEGIDWKVPIGNEVYAAADGVVSDVQLTDKTSPYGNYVRIQHEGGAYETIYAHLAYILVRRQQPVQAGDVIALSGNSGTSTTGPHLHLTLKKRGASTAGETAFPKDVMDPTPYLAGPESAPASPKLLQLTLNGPLMLEVVSPDEPLKLRQGPGREHAILSQLPHKTLLETREAPLATLQKVGVYGAWLNVSAPGGQEGYVGAWYLQLASAASRGAVAPEMIEEMRIPYTDDLQRIKGIGPKIAALFAAVGITTFRQMAALTPEQLQAVLAEGGLRGRDVDTWPAQAHALLEQR